MFTSSFFLGSFAGPFISGFLVERFGFRRTSAFFLIAYVAVMTLDLAEWFLICVTGRSKDRKWKIKYSKLDQDLA